MNAMSNDVRNQVLAQYIGTAAGRAKIASSLTQPLRLQRDYTSVGRKTFLVEQLPDGALPYYDKDPYVTAYVIGEEGNSIEARVKSKRVTFPIFDIAALPEAPINEIKNRRFDVIQRMKDLGAAQIQAEEDTRVFEVMDAIATYGFDTMSSMNADINAGAPLTASDISDAFGSVAQWDLHVSRIFMNAKDYSDILKWGRDVFCPEDQQILRKTGIMGTIYGATVIVTRRVPVGTVYVCAEPEFFGRIPVRTELSVLSCDDPKARTIGFSMFESIGVGCHNPLALCRIKIAR